MMDAQLVIDEYRAEPSKNLPGSPAARALTGPVDTRAQTRIKQSKTLRHRSADIPGLDENIDLTPNHAGHIGSEAVPHQA
jgi:hypothetical protein